MTAQVVPITPAGGETGLSVQFSDIETSTVIGPTVSPSQRMVVTYLQIDWGGTTEGDFQLYFGSGAFVRGTSRTLFDGGGHPTPNTRGGYTSAKPNGWTGGAGEELRITISAAVDPLSVTIWYELIAA